MNKAQEMLAKAGFPDTAAGRAAFHKQYPTPESFFQVHGNSDTDMYKAGGGIHIKPSKRGTFTAAASKHGKSVQAFASQVLANKGNYSPAMVKKANFARNAAKWKHEDGGPVMYADGGKLPEGILRSRLEAHMSPDEAQNYIDSYALGSVVNTFSGPPDEEEAIMNARLSSSPTSAPYDRFPKKDPGFGYRGPNSYISYIDRLKNRNVHYATPHKGVKDAPVNMHTITGSCESGTCYEFHKDGGVVDAYQLMGMPTPPMYNYGSHITHYTPSFNFGHVQSADNTYRHGFGYGGPIGKYDFGSTIKTIGAAAYGAGEGLLDTVTLGATDQLTDAGYNALQKAGGSSEAEKHKQNAWHGGFQTAGAVTGAVLNPSSLGTAITEGSQGVGEVIGESNPNSEKAQKWRQGVTQVGGLAGMATGMGAFGAPGGGAAGLAKTQNFQSTGLGNFAGNAAKAGQGFNAISSGNPMAMLGAFGGMGGMGGGSNMGTTGTSNFSPDPNQYMNQGLNFNYSSPSFHAMGGAVNAPEMMQYADGGLLGMGGINKFSGLSANNGLLGMGGINKFSNMFADGGFLNKAAATGIMGLGPALLAGKMADGGLLGLGGINKFSGSSANGGFLGTMIPLAKPFMADGGNTPATEINVERGELLVNKNGKILTEYRGGGMVPHPSDGSMDPRGTVPAQEGQFVITKRLAPSYKSAMENNDKLYATAMRNNIAFDKQRKEAKQQAMMAKNGGMVGQYGYGGGIMKYDGGAGVPPGPREEGYGYNFEDVNPDNFYDFDPSTPFNIMNVGTYRPNIYPSPNAYGNPAAAPVYNVGNLTGYSPTNFRMPSVGAPDKNAFITSQVYGSNPNTSYGPWNAQNAPTSPVGPAAPTQDLQDSQGPLGNRSYYDFPDTPDTPITSVDNQYAPIPGNDETSASQPSWFSRNKQDLGRAVPYATSLGLGMEALLQKPFQMNAEDYKIKSKLSPYEEQYRPDYRAYNAALYSSKNNPNLAARTELFNTAQKGFADEKYRVNQANLARKMQADQYNIGLEGQNLNTAMQIAQFNEQNKAARRNAIREQFGKNLPAAYYADQSNQMSKQALSAYYKDKGITFPWDK